MITEYSYHNLKKCFCKYWIWGDLRKRKRAVSCETTLLKFFSGPFIVLEDYVESSGDRTDRTRPIVVFDDCDTFTPCYHIVIEFVFAVELGKRKWGLSGSGNAVSFIEGYYQPVVADELGIKFPRFVGVARLNEFALAKDDSKVIFPPLCLMVEGVVRGRHNHFVGLLDSQYTIILSHD